MGIKKLINLRLGPKLIAAFLLIGIIPFAIVGFVSSNNSGEALQEQAFNQLGGVRGIKKAQIEKFFGERQGDMGVLMETVGTLRQQAFNNLTAVQAIKLSQIEKFFGERQGDMGVLMETVGTLRKEAFAKLEAVQQNKRNQIDQYFKRVAINLSLLAKNPTTVRAVSEFETAFEAGGDQASGPQWSAVESQYGPVFTNLLKEDGYYDVFLIAADGDVVFSATKESDLGENLVSGALKNSGLAHAFVGTREKEISFADFSPYAPSGNKPAGFLAKPVLDADGRFIGAVAVQLPINQINEVMQERTGLGETGETYLVGPDTLMRSDSFLDPKNHTVEASFANPDIGKVDTEAATTALGGKAGGEVINDYNGNPVLSVYSPMDVYGVRWAIIAEIDVAEAFVPVDAAGKEFYAKYVDMYGYYDLFVMNPDGYVFYTASKEADYQTNMVSGKYNDSGLGKLTRKVLETKKFGFADFEPYAPSAGEPAAFIAQPVINKGKVEVIVALQLSLDAINAIMSERTGLGETGETYLIGPDKLMRSDSFLDPKYHTVKASFANPTKGSVDTEAANLALEGKKGAKIVADYNGNPVLSAYAPLEIFGTRWAILAEIDVAEAFVPVDAAGKEYYSKYVDMYGYYDMFVMNPDGYVFYTASKEADYQTNMVSGKYKDSGLGKLVRNVIGTKKYGIADFEPYAPSNGEPAAFIAQPVTQGGKVEMVIALQLSLDAINEVMQQRDGMGETGETYLVGSDKLMRSDSFLDPTNHSVKASFANPSVGSVNTDATKKALAGETGAEIIIDYNGNPVLSAYTPLKIGDTTWALIAEIDESEAFAAVDAMEKMMLILAVIGVAIILFAAYLIARSLSGPIIAMTDSMKELAGGNLDAHVPAQGRPDEIGEMADAVQVFKDNAIRVKEMEAEQEAAKQRAEEEKRATMNQMADEFQASVGGIVETVSSASTQMQSTAQSMSSTAEETSRQATAVAAAAEQASANVQTVASAAEELSSSISEIGRQVSQSSEIAGRAVRDANNTNQQIEGLAKAADKIGEVVALITDIAEQTNLLALNATIEAARAGDAGKGFAVVASEVKNLANQTAKATDEISGQIGGIQTATKDAVVAIKGIGTTIGEINEIASTIAAAVEEQGAATQEIARNVEQAAAGTNDVTSNIGGVNQAAGETGAAATQVLGAATQLSQESETLRSEVDQFVVKVRAA
jgi:methyl-accepting chemotaxis protein